MLIEEQEFEKVREHLSNYPIFTQLLSQNWIGNTLLNQEERLQKHALFWELLDKAKVVKLVNELTALNSDSQIIPSVISKIKSCNNSDSFDSLRTEIMVLAYYKNRETANFKVKFEPQIPNSARKNDILLLINKEPHYVEIFTILYDEIERNNRELEDRVKAKIEGIDNNPFLVSFSLFSTFIEQDIEGLTQFLETKIADLSSTGQSKAELIFEKENEPKADIWLIKDGSKRSSSVGMIMSEVRRLSTDRRLKNLILTKTEQFSPNTKNILITHLAHIPAHFDDYENALLGVEGVRINKITMKSTPFRERNGAIHDPRTKRIGGFICFRNWDYTSRIKALNPNADNIITDSAFSLT